MVSEHKPSQKVTNVPNLDPLSNFLSSKLHLNYISAGSISLTYTLFLYGYLIILNDELNFRNIFALAFRCILFSLLPVIYLWSGQAIFRLLSNLAEVKSLEVSEEDWRIVKTYYKKSKILHLCSVFFAVLHSSLFGLLIFSPNLSRWEYASALIKIVAVGVNTIFSYMLFSLLITLILNVKFLHKFFVDKSLKVKLLHPDRCGGLRPLSRYTLYSAYAVAVVGGMIGLSEYMIISGPAQSASSPTSLSLLELVFPSQFNFIWFLHSLVIAYIFLSLVIFFGPLLVVHREMLEAKENLLKDISNQFQADYGNLKMLLNEDSSTLREQVEKLNQLDAIYSRTNTFPVWPFDIQTLKKYLLSVAAPLLPSISAFIASFLQNLLSQIVA
ncbi:MAG: hypothetical protein AB4042_11240 [Leptolyngbyaceae cyanobacterium]